MRILDESNGGFGVESEEDPGCQVGDTLLLEVALAWVEVQVAHIERQEPKPDDPDSQLHPASTRLGLMRLREVDQYEACADARLWLLWCWFRSGLNPLAPLGRSCKRTGAMILAVAASGIVIIWVIENSLSVVDALKAHAGKGEYRRVEIRLPFVLSPRNSNSSASNRRGNSATESRTSVPPAENADHLHPEFLLRSEVDRLLSLRPQQREQLHKLLEEHRAGDTPLGRKASQILTAEQRQVLSKLYAPAESSQ